MSRDYINLQDLQSIMQGLETRCACICISMFLKILNRN